MVLLLGQVREVLVQVRDDLYLLPDKVRESLVQVREGLIQVIEDLHLLPDKVICCLVQAIEDIHLLLDKVTCSLINLWITIKLEALIMITTKGTVVLRSLVILLYCLY